MAKGWGAFIGLISGMAAVWMVNVKAPSVAFLWYNVIGAVVVVIVGVVVSLVIPSRRPAA
jgi:hypothetical protein